MAWRNFSKHFKQQVSEFLEIPGDIILDLPKITLMGGLQLSVENHRGILKYGAEETRINTSEGELIIKGRDLRLRSVLPEEILLEGKIKSITFGGGD